MQNTNNDFTIQYIENSSLDICPEPLQQIQNSDTVMHIGDEHGNLKRTLFDLVKFGAIKATPDLKTNYDALVTLYNKAFDKKHAKQDFSEEIKQMLTIIDKLEFNTNTPKIMLHGDLIGDRGLCDLLILRLIKTPENL